MKPFIKIKYNYTIKELQKLLRSKPVTDGFVEVFVDSTYSYSGELEKVVDIEYYTPKDWNDNEGLDPKDEDYNNDEGWYFTTDPDRYDPELIELAEVRDIIVKQQRGIKIVDKKRIP